MKFEEIAPYLKDPLVLIGFIVFLGFLFIRYLVKHKIIPPLPPGNGFKILKTILLYGFIIGLAIIVLGFGLKYKESNNEEQREITKQEEFKLKQRKLDTKYQETVYNLLKTEFSRNLDVVNQLKQNIEVIISNQIRLTQVTRQDGVEILKYLFPIENIASGKKKVFKS